MYKKIFVMLKENQKTSHTDVMPAIAKFVDDAFFQGEIQTLEKNIQEPFDLLLTTEYGNTQELRLKMYNAMQTIRSFTKCFENFTQEEVELACKKYCDV